MQSQYDTIFAERMLPCFILLKDKYGANVRSVAILATSNQSANEGICKRTHFSVQADRVRYPDNAATSRFENTEHKSLVPPLSSS